LAKNTLVLLKHLKLTSFKHQMFFTQLFVYFLYANFHKVSFYYAVMINVMTNKTQCVRSRITISLTHFIP